MGGLDGKQTAIHVSVTHDVLLVNAVTFSSTTDTFSSQQSSAIVVFLHQISLPSYSTAGGVVLTLITDPTLPLSIHLKASPFLGRRGGIRRGSIQYSFIMERDSSSDEEDDRSNLILQNDTKPMSPAERRMNSAFDVEDFRSQIRSRRFNRRYLFAVILPLIVVILYFSTGSIFSSSISSIRFSSVDDRMRESELRAMYLLKQQQLGLFAMWNRALGSTDRNSSLDSSNSSVTNDQVLEDFKSSVLKQISLNKEIQDVLLLPYQSGNLSTDSNVRVPNIGVSGFDRCGKADQRWPDRKTIEWKPKSDKYLLAVCVSGQMSNHLICLEKHMFFAAMLNRVLVIPSSKVDFQFNRVLDIDHINQCLGRKVVMQFDEFAEAKKNHFHIDRFICYFSSPQNCFVDEEHVKKLKGLGISMGKLESPWLEDVKKPSKRSIQDIEAKFSSNDDVIAIGDVFFANVEQQMVMQPGGPIAHKCKTLIEPSRLIMLTAQRFIQTFLGKNFAALHFRRHGFLKFWCVITLSRFINKLV